MATTDLDPKAPLKRGIRATLTLVLATATSLFLGYFALVILVIGTCGGDGGEPNAAEGSAQAGLCNWLEAGWGWMFPIAGFVLFAAAVVIAVEWAGDRVRARTFYLAATAVALYPIAVFILLTLPGDA